MEKCEHNENDVTLEASGGSIARWTEKGKLSTTVIPGLSLYRREDPIRSLGPHLQGAGY